MSRDPTPRLPNHRSADIQLKRTAKCLVVLLAVNLLSAAPAAESTSDSSQGISRAAADSCSAKVKKLEEFETNTDPGKKQTTRFTQEELNSYLALDLSSKYGPGLKSLMLTLEEAKLKGDAAIDFDHLGMRTSKLLARIMIAMFSGTHTLSARGKIIAQDGKANFQLEEARYDNTSLPNFLVEEIITAVGRKQRPPFDPMQPSQMPYRIERVELHAGYILVYQ